MEQLENIIIIGFWSLFSLYIVYQLYKSIRIVSAQDVIIVERLGKYSRTLHAGFHLLIPFIDKDRYYLSLKEQAFEVPPQICITKDNVQVEVDGVLYLKVLLPEKACYGIVDYKFASTQLAQTTMRAILGTMQLDTTFESREAINAKIVEVLEQASEPWGIRVNRYEIINIKPPKTVQEAMEKEKKAQITKKAQISLSEGDRDSRVNRSMGLREEMINKSEGEKQKRINEAEGFAKEIESIAIATSTGIKEIAHSIQGENGERAMQLRIQQKFIAEIQKISNSGKISDVVLPVNLADFNSLMNSVSLKK